MFEDRQQAAERLAEALAAYRGRRPLVLAVPRGAVPMAAVIAQRLQGELDLVLVRKLHAPGAPEFAIGAVDEAGWVYLAPHASAVGGNPGYVAEQKLFELEELQRRRALYTPGRPPLDAAGRVVIVVDDGLATGATMVAALHAVRQRQPARLVCAVPVASRDSVELVRPYADEVVVLEVPHRFAAVSQFYRAFPQLEEGFPCEGPDFWRYVSAEPQHTRTDRPTPPHLMRVYRKLGEMDNSHGGIRGTPPRPHLSPSFA